MSPVFSETGAEELLPDHLLPDNVAHFYLSFGMVRGEG